MDRRWIPIAALAAILVAGWKLATYTVPQWEQAIVVQLGEPVRLSVHSNAYGKLLFAITLAGGSVLALLVARRLYHRFRGQPDRADLDRPRRPAEIDA